MIYFLIYYPDTTLPPTESAQEYERNQVRSLNAPPKGLQTFGEKVESWQGFVGLNGLLWNIVVLNQPNAKTMPISQKHWASPVNSTRCVKTLKMSVKNPILSQLREPRPCQRPHTSPAYMTHVTRTHAIPHNARCTPHITRPYVTQHNPCGTSVCHLHKSLDSSCYGLGSDLN